MTPPEAKAAVLRMALKPLEEAVRQPDRAFSAYPKNDAALLAQEARHLTERISVALDALSVPPESGTMIVFNSLPKDQSAGTP